MLCSILARPIKKSYPCGSPRTSAAPRWTRTPPARGPRPRGSARPSRGRLPGKRRRCARAAPPAAGGARTCARREDGRRDAAAARRGSSEDGRRVATSLVRRPSSRGVGETRGRPRGFSPAIRAGGPAASAPATTRSAAASRRETTARRARREELPPDLLADVRQGIQLRDQVRLELGLGARDVIVPEHGVVARAELLEVRHRLRDGGVDALRRRREVEPEEPRVFVARVERDVPRSTRSSAEAVLCD